MDDNLRYLLRRHRQIGSLESLADYVRGLIRVGIISPRNLSVAAAFDCPNIRPLAEKLGIAITATSDREMRLRRIQAEIEVIYEFGWLPLLRAITDFGLHAIIPALYGVSPEILGSMDTVKDSIDQLIGAFNEDEITSENLRWWLDILKNYQFHLYATNSAEAERIQRLVGFLDAWQDGFVRGDCPPRCSDNKDRKYHVHQFHPPVTSVIYENASRTIDRVNVLLDMVINLLREEDPRTSSRQNMGFEFADYFEIVRASGLMYDQYKGLNLNEDDFLRKLACQKLLPTSLD